jgi:hypothetical protein
MGKVIDLTGQHFGLLVVLHSVEKPDYAKDKGIYWLCKCDCDGKEIILPGAGLRNGKTKSCGCTLHSDLTGKRFGILTVIEQCGRDRNNKILWRCKCDCGEETIGETSSLNNGYKKSCGCLKHIKQDLTGQRFGRLVVLNRTRVDGGRNVFWKCLCDCGNIKEVRGRLLKSGNTKSCGCYALELAYESAEDLTGQRFGRLVVIELIRVKNKNNNKSMAYWKCLCDCGNYKTTAARTLKCGQALSCGCLRKERLLEANSKSFGESSFNEVYSSYRGSAKKRGLEFNLTKEDVRILINNRCFYCGRESSNLQKSSSNNGDYLYNGIDRVNNYLGYTLDNVVSCCYMCNWSKREKTKVEFLLWIKDVYEYSIKKNGEN